MFNFDRTVNSIKATRSFNWQFKIFGILSKSYGHNTPIRRIRINTGALTATSNLHVEVTMPVKRPGMAANLGRSSADKLVVTVNRRVVQLKQVERVARETFARASGEEKFPVGFINIHLDHR